MKKNKNGIFIIGHRGASAIAPPNTLKAFEKAIELKADYSEFDIHLTRDGEIVIIHDSDTLNTTGVKGIVKDMTLDQIKKLDAGEGEKIPTLQELVNLARDKMGLQIEIKATNLLDNLLNILKKEDLVSTCIISSFMLSEVQKLKLLEPDVKVGLLTPMELIRPSQYKRKIIQLAKNDFYSIHPYYTRTDKELVDFAHDQGLNVIVWTVNTRRAMKKLIEIGVDGIITDDISLANEIVGRKT
jgi:glycerophosphoryl diester phosphodiesterase